LCQKKLPTIIYVLITLMSIGLALADEEISEAEGLRFDSNQTVEGFGIANSYRCMQSSTLMLQSHLSGSGVSSRASRTYVRNDEIVQGSPLSFSGNRSVGIQEILSNEYAPTKLDYPGSFRSEPIRTLWSDSTIAGNDGIALKAGFDQVRTLKKEMTTKISDGGSYEERTRAHSSFSFSGSMELNALFNGTGQIGEYVGTLNGKNPDALLDEFYRGTFNISKKMMIGFKSNLLQDEDEWLSCCSGGWDGMNYIDKESFPVDVGSVFNSPVPLNSAKIGKTVNITSTFDR
jgi:hypothetical protein